MPLQAFHVGPELREMNEPGIEWVFRHILGNAAVVLVRCIDQLLEMRKKVIQALRREAHRSENR